MRTLLSYIIILAIAISCTSQKIKVIKVQNEFDQKLADSLGADKYGMKPRSGEINSKG